MLRLTHVSSTGAAPTRRKALLRGVLVAWPVGIGLWPYAVPSLLYVGWLTWDAASRPDGRHWVDRVTGSVVLPRNAAT
ncbi:MAG: hypothetical protein ABIM89_12775 [Mycobacteriales bacterium]